MIDMKMTYSNMQDALEQLNEKWGFDFVSATSGDCCNTCGQYFTPEDIKKYYEAETYLVVKWFFDGMNYDGEFEDQGSLWVKYGLGNKITLEQVCKDLKSVLSEYYEVIQPKNEAQCIILEKRI